MKDKIDSETEKKIQELQILEQNVQALMMQKQAFQLEFSETENALNEVKKSKSEIYKIVGQIMLKAEKQETEKELSHKNEIISLRVRAIEKQEKDFREKLEKLRKEVTEKLK